jgi:N-acetylneuraminic acid mutarotase
MLKIDWRRGPDLPQGLQDSDGGFIGSHLVTVAGFCSGRELDNRRKPARYPRGFLDKAWALDTSRPDARWESLPPLPGAPRQGPLAVALGDALYVWGGFSYSLPFCYADGFRLSRAHGHWKWDPLPALPYRLTSAAACVIDERIYVLGGADYDGTIGYHTQADRAGRVPRLGARLWVLDASTLQNLETADATNKSAWRELPQLPGTPRFVHALAAVGGELYVIGGAAVVPHGGRDVYCTVVDNWKFDPRGKTWSRLRDLPISSGNFPKSVNLVFHDRYIVLPGGHQYDCVANPDGTVRARYGRASQLRPQSGLYNNCFVYNTHSGLFGSADPLPIDNNLPMAVVRGDEIYLLGGETGGGEIEGVWYGHHPDLLLIGKISESAPR